MSKKSTINLDQVEKSRKGRVVLIFLTLAVLATGVAILKIELPKEVEFIFKPQSQEEIRKNQNKLPDAIIATGNSLHLGKSFEEMKSRYGMCEMKNGKPVRMKRVWPKTLKPTGTAQAQWQLKNKKITLVWLPPGPESGAVVVKIQSEQPFKPEEIIKALEANAPVAWQKNIPNRIQNAYKKYPKFLEVIKNKEIPQFSYWRMDGASVEIRDTEIIFKNSIITRMELKELLREIENH